MLLEMFSLEMPPKLSPGLTDSKVPLLPRENFASISRSPTVIFSSAQTTMADPHEIFHALLNQKAALRPSAKEAAFSLNILLDSLRLQQLVFGR